MSRHLVATLYSILLLLACLPVLVQAQQCPGESIWNGSACVCPSNSLWNSNTQNCACPSGMAWDVSEQKCVSTNPIIRLIDTIIAWLQSLFQAPPSTIVTATHVCPSGSAWASDQNGCVCLPDHPDCTATCSVDYLWNGKECIRVTQTTCYDSTGLVVPCMPTMTYQSTTMILTTTGVITQQTTSWFWTMTTGVSTQQTQQTTTQIASTVTGTGTSGTSPTLFSYGGTLILISGEYWLDQSPLPGIMPLQFATQTLRDWAAAHVNAHVTVWGHWQGSFVVESIQLE